MSGTALMQGHTISGLLTLSLRSKEAEMVMLPQLGAKIYSFRDLRTGREWLWRDLSRPLRRATYGDDFADYDISGIDECLPTVAPCIYPEGAFRGRRLPDHGDLWSREWEARILNGVSILTSIDGVCLPYRLRRVVRLDGPVLSLRYHLQNLSSHEVCYHWAAHSLLAAEQGMRVELPGNPRLLKEFGTGGRIGPDDPDQHGHRCAHRWPYVRGEDGKVNDLRELRFPDPRVIDKVYATDLVAGEARLIHQTTGTSLNMRWDLEHVPYLGVCTNMGAWPPSGAAGRWVALEPCTATADRLDVAVATGRSATLPAGGHKQWTLTLRLSQRS